MDRDEALALLLPEVFTRRDVKKLWDRASLEGANAVIRRLRNRGLCEFAPERGRGYYQKTESSNG